MTRRRSRRRFLSGVAAAGLAAPAAGRRRTTGEAVDDPAAATRPPETWRMFAAGPANRGWPGKGTGPDTLAERWRFGTGDWVQSSPAVVDGTVYFGSDDGHVYAVDAGSGTRQWSYDTGERDQGVSSSPAVVGGTVYVGAGDRHVHALDADSGAERWRVDLGAWVFAPPTVAGGTVYVGAYDGSVYALDAAVGDVQWTHRTGNRVMEAAAVADGTVYVGSHDRSIYALDADAGTVRWSFETGDVVNTAPTVVGDTVFAGSKDARVYAVDAATGEEHWRFDTGRTVSPVSPAVFDGTVYTGNSSTYALDAATGERVWLRRRRITGPPAVVGRTLYVPGSDGVRSVDPATGERLGTGPTDDLVWTGAVVADGTVYAGDRSDNLYAFGPAGGEATAAQTEAPSRASPTTWPPERTETAVRTSTPDGTSVDTAPAPTDAATSTPTDWFAGWRGLLAWLGVVMVGGPVVLGALAGLVGRGGDGDGEDAE